jgi:hypothetical protein
MKAEEAVGVFQRLAALDGKSPWGPEKELVYAEALRYVPGEEVLTAVRELIATSPWRPTVSDILARVAENRDPLPTPEETLRCARALVSQSPGNVGRNYHALVAEYVDLYGGWPSLRYAESDRLQRELPERYAQARASWLRKVATTLLMPREERRIGSMMPQLTAYTVAPAGYREGEE